MVDDRRSCCDLQASRLQPEAMFSQYQMQVLMTLLWSAEHCCCMVADRRSWCDLQASKLPACGVVQVLMTLLWSTDRQHCCSLVADRRSWVFGFFANLIYSVFCRQAGYSMRRCICGSRCRCCKHKPPACRRMWQCTPAACKLPMPSSRPRESRYSLLCMLCTSGHDTCFQPVVLVAVSEVLKLPMQSSGPGGSRVLDVYFR